MAEVATKHQPLEKLVEPLILALYKVCKDATQPYTRVNVPGHDCFPCSSSYWHIPMTWFTYLDAYPQLLQWLRWHDYGCLLALRHARISQEYYAVVTVALSSPFLQWSECAPSKDT
eukprot:1136364-Pelagomonas_calceolata.AAC.3